MFLRFAKKVVTTNILSPKHFRQPYLIFKKIYRVHKSPKCAWKFDKGVVVEILNNLLYWLQYRPRPNKVSLPITVRTITQVKNSNEFELIVSAKEYEHTSYFDRFG